MWPRMIGRCVSTTSFPTLEALRDTFPKDFYFLENIISPEEEVNIVRQLDVLLKRRKYEGGHWDDVISRYKEIELNGKFLANASECRTAVERVQACICCAFNRHDYQFLDPHVVDLAADGDIKGHVDSVKFSGELVAGLSLLSPRVLRLAPASSEDIVSSGGASTDKVAKNEQHSGGSSPPRVFEFTLPPRSLYIIRGKLRYEYTHAILGQKQHDEMNSGGNSVTEYLDSSLIARRLSVIIRDARNDNDALSS